MRVAVGVDTGKSRHQAAAYEPGADRIVGQLGFSVDRAGFDRFRGFLERLAPARDQVVIGLEATGHYHLTLVEYLVGLGYRVALLNPLQAAQFRRSQAGGPRPTAWMSRRWPASWPCAARGRSRCRARRWSRCAS